MVSGVTTAVARAGSTNPSPAKERSASRTGMRLIPRSAASSCRLSFVPASSSPERIRSRITLVAVCPAVSMLPEPGSMCRCVVPAGIGATGGDLIRY